METIYRSVIEKYYEWLRPAGIPKWFGVDTVVSVSDLCTSDKASAASGSKAEDNAEIGNEERY